MNMTEKKPSGSVAFIGGDGFDQRHYSMMEISRLWKVGRATVRKLFMNEPGVLRVNEGTGKRITYLVPEVVMKRVYTRLTS